MPKSLLSGVINCVEDSFGAWAPSLIPLIPQPGHTTAITSQVYYTAEEPILGRVHHSNAHQHRCTDLLDVFVSSEHQMIAASATWHRVVARVSIVSLINLQV